MIWHYACSLIFPVLSFLVAGSAVSEPCTSHCGPSAIHSFKQDASPFTEPQPLPTLCPCPLFPGQLWGGRPSDHSVRRERESRILSLWEEITHSLSHWLTLTAVHRQKFRAVVSKLPQTGCYILAHDRIYTITCTANLKCNCLRKLGLLFREHYCSTDLTQSTF